MSSLEDVMKRERTLFSLVDKLPDAVWFKDADERWLYANDHALQRFGLEEFPYRGKTDLELAEFNPYLREFFISCLAKDKQVWQQDQPVRYEEMVQGLNNRTYIYDIRKVPFFNKTEGRLGILTVARDVTDDKKAEQSLVEREQIYRSLFDHHPDAIFSFNLKGQFQSVNSVAEEMIGYREDELRGRSILDFIPEEETQKILHHFHQVIDGNPQKFEFSARRKNGSMTELEVITVPIMVNQQIVGVHGIAKDITRRKKAEEELITIKEQLEAFVRHTADSIVIFDAQRRVLQVNEAFERLFGWTAKEILGKPLPTIEEQYQEEADRLLSRIQQGEQVIGYETRRLRKDGSTIDVSLTLSPIRDSKGNFIAYSTITRDITERKKTEDLMRRSDMLSIAGQLAAGVAHEIRNPLTSLRGFTQILKSKTDEHAKYLDIMLTEIDRINFIISEYLLLAKPQIETYRQNDLRHLLENIVAIADTQAIMHNIQLILEAEKDIPLITCEENRLKQVFINIVKNAMEAMPDGGKITIKLKKLNANQVMVRFIDQGYGIPKDRIPKLGEPFYTTKEKGTGLGLMVSYKIIQDHKGTISFRSQLNKGTTVDVVLPIKP